MTELSGRNEGSILQPNSMMNLVAFFQSTEDAYLAPEKGNASQPSGNTKKTPGTQNQSHQALFCLANLLSALLIYICCE